MKKSALIAALIVTNFCFAQTETTTTTSTPTEFVKPTSTIIDSNQIDDVRYSDNDFGFSLFSLGGMDRTQITDGSGTPSMYFFENFLSLSYKIRENVRFSARYSFNYSTAGINKYGDDVTDMADTRDASLLLGFSHLFEDYLPEYLSYSFQPRLYLPTSEKSKAQGTITSLRLENTLKIYTQRYSYLRLWVKPHYFFQKSTVYLNENGWARTTDMLELKTGAEYSWSLNKTFSLKPGFEIEDNWSNASSASNLKEYRTTDIDYRFGVEYRVMKALSFTLGYGHKKDLIRTDEFTDGFTLMTNATFL
jgi:hypothetical protein